MQHLTQIFYERTPTRESISRCIPLPVHPRDRQARLLAIQRLLENTDRPLGLHRENPATPDLLRGTRFTHTGTSPQTPRHRRRRQTTTTAILSKRIEKRVRGSVIALATRTPRRSQRREHA